MEQYQTLIGVVIEKLDQTYKDLAFNYNGLSGVLQQHTQEEIQKIPELTTIRDLRDSYADMMQCMEKLFPGIKS